MDAGCVKLDLHGALHVELARARAYARPVSVFYPSRCLDSPALVNGCVIIGSASTEPRRDGAGNLIYALDTYCRIDLGVGITWTF